jgi:hypothetical protein
MKTVTHTFLKSIDNFRGHINSLDNWEASTGEKLELQEIPVINNSLISPFGRHLQPLSELEKQRDYSRAKWTVNTSKLKDACATIDAYRIGDNETKIKFIDGNVPYELPPERKEIGQAFSEFVNILTSEIPVKFKEYKEITELINSKSNRKGNDYVDLERIIQLKSIQNSEYDLKRLISLCEELNIASQNYCYMTIAMIVRAIIDHVPPIFKVKNFSEVANNYKGSQSFKKAMGHLNNSLKNIANSHLHVQIRKKKSYQQKSKLIFLQILIYCFLK